MKAKIKIGVIICAFTLMHCASQAAFLYTRPNPVAAPGELVLVLRPIVDARPLQEKEPMEGVLETDLLVEVESAIRAEMESMGAFEKIELIGEESSVRHDEVALTIQLHQFTWEVPQHNEMATTHFVMNVFSAGLSGLLYGFTETSVYGRVALSMAFTQQDKLLWEKQYTKTYQEKCKRILSDAPETKARVTSRALHRALQEMKQDLLECTKWSFAKDC